MPARLSTDTELTLAFVDDEEIRGLNARHRGQDRVTDVLSFGPTLPRDVRGAAVARHLERGVDGSLELGDIVLSPEQARRQSKRRRWTVKEEIAFLAAHGALHLIGYEDDTPRGYREMRRLGEQAVREARQILKKSRGHGRPEH